MNLIASSLPGRLRLRAPALRRAAPLRRLVAGLGELPGVLAVAANERAGSVVLTYDAGRIARGDMEATALHAAGSVLDVGVDGAKVETSAPPAAAAERSVGGLAPSLRVRVNRPAKRGMLGSSLVSLALAAAGAKRWHVLSGGAFLVFLTLHLAVHRRHLLR